MGINAISIMPQRKSRRMRRDSAKESVINWGLGRIGWCGMDSQHLVVRMAVAVGAAEAGAEVEGAPEALRIGMPCCVIVWIGINGTHSKLIWGWIADQWPQGWP